MFSKIVYSIMTAHFVNSNYQIRASSVAAFFYTSSSPAYKKCHCRKQFISDLLLCKLMFTEDKQSHRVCEFPQSER